MSLTNKIQPFRNNIKLLIIIIIFMVNNSFTQISDDINSRWKYNITQSIGAGFKEHELAFYLTISGAVNKNLNLGLKGGVYNYSENTSNKIIDTFIAPIYSQLNAGYYEIYINKMTIQGTTYIGSFYAGYLGIENFLFNAGVGVKIHKESDYSLTVGFSKSSQSQSAPKPEDLYLDDLKPAETRIVIKPYFSLGADYKLGFLNFGIYADNIYSAGLNVGVSF